MCHGINFGGRQNKSVILIRQTSMNGHWKWKWTSVSQKALPYFSIPLHAEHPESANRPINESMSFATTSLCETGVSDRTRMKRKHRNRRVEKTLKLPPIQPHIIWGRSSSSLSLICDEVRHYVLQFLLPCTHHKPKCSAANLFPNWAVCVYKDNSLKSK